MPLSRSLCLQAFAPVHPVVAHVAAAHYGLSAHLCPGQQRCCSPAPAAPPPPQTAQRAPHAACALPATDTAALHCCSTAKPQLRTLQTSNQAAATGMTINMVAVCSASKCRCAPWTVCGALAYLHPGWQRRWLAAGATGQCPSLRQPAHALPVAKGLRGGQAQAARSNVKRDLNQR